MRSLFALVVLPACLTFGAAGSDVKVTPGERALVETIGKRLLDALPLMPEYSKMERYKSWPPPFLVSDSDEINAFADVGWSPQISVTKGFLDKVSSRGADSKDQEARLAWLLAHELGHVVLMHVHPNHRKKHPPLLGRAFDRQLESAADVFGTNLLLKAGFSASGARNCIGELIRLGDYTSVEALHHRHPSLRDRAAVLFKDEASYWRATGAFETGVFFLDRELFIGAEVCFQSVVKEFPKCHEGWANLGYALLMQYCDMLRPENLKRLDIGHIVCDGFYRRPDSLIEIPVRGKDETWEEAIKALEEAKRLKPELTLVHSNLGLAYLVHPKGKKVDEAQRHLEQAARLLREGEAPAEPDNRRVSGSAGASPSQHVTERVNVLANLGLARIAAGQLEAGEALFAEVEKLLQQNPRLPSRRAVSSALRYNRALILSKSDAGKAATLFEEYLTRTNPAGLWWPLAYDNYVRLCKQLGRNARAEKSFHVDLPARFRPVAGIKVDDIPVALAQPVSHLQERLGKPSREVLVYPGSKLRRLYYDKHGFSALADDNILAVSLRAEALELPLYESGVGTVARTLKVGMPFEKLDELLGGYERRSRRSLDGQSEYLFYYDVGLAVKVENGRAVEIVVAQIPRRERGDL